MPSPSRIPRCKVSKASSKEVPEKQKCIQSKNSKLTSFYKPTIKSSQTILAERNRDSSAKPVPDKRGITEVKRCEKALKSKVKALEKELADMKIKLQTDQQAVEKVKTKNHLIIKEAPDECKKEFMQLEQSKKGLFDQLMPEEGMLNTQSSTEKECAEMLLNLSVFENTCNGIIDKLSTLNI